MIKALALDIDNTLLNPQGELNQPTEEAVKQAVRAGLHVILATARGYRSTQAVHQQLGLTGPVVCHAGALVYDFASGHKLASWPLPQSLAISLTKLAAELDLTISAYVDHEVWFNRPPDGPLRSDWLVQTDLAASLQNASEVLEMVVVGENQVQQLRQSLLDRQLAANLNLTVVDQANETLMFIGRIGNDKAVALDWLFRRLGVNWSQVAACGDSSADLEMIRRAGWGLAAPAASEIVRQAHHAPLQLDPNEPIASLVERILQDSKFSDR